jgi:hypothetical protein
MFLLPTIVMSTFLTIGLTILGVAIVLIGLFYLMYHTFHGDLPGLMKLIIGVFLIVAALFILVAFVL